MPLLVQWVRLVGFDCVTSSKSRILMLNVRLLKLLAHKGAMASKVCAKVSVAFLSVNLVQTASACLMVAFGKH